VSVPRIANAASIRLLIARKGRRSIEALLCPIPGVVRAGTKRRLLSSTKFGTKSGQCVVRDGSNVRALDQKGRRAIRSHRQRSTRQGRPLPSSDRFFVRATHHQSLYANAVVELTKSAAFGYRTAALLITQSVEATDQYAFIRLAVPFEGADVCDVAEDAS
jgi:hypothetical protein